MQQQEPAHPSIAPVPREKAYLLINHGPATLVSARHDGVDNVMAASWVTGLDVDPPKLTVVLGKDAKTRELAEKSGTFIIQVPTVAQLSLTYQVGHRSLSEDSDKLRHCGVELQSIDGVDKPFVVGCSAWLLCKIIPEKHNQEAYDLFIGEVVGAWADTRAFEDGRWKYEAASPIWRSLHYTAGGHFYALGEALDVDEVGAKDLMPADLHSL